MTWIWSGQAFEPSGALPLTDRGFRYGMSFFETVGIRAARPVLLEEHLELLDRSLDAAGWPVPVEAFSFLPGLLSRCGVQNGAARIYVTAGDGGPGDPVELPRVTAHSEELASPGRTSRPRCRLVALPDPAPFPARPGMKTGNYWPSIDALGRARAAGADECVRFGAGDEIISCAMANLFLVFPDEIVTPSAFAARRGITRAWVLRQGVFGGRPIRERAVNLAELSYAAEIFLTNSRVGVWPAAGIDGRTLGGAVGVELSDRFDGEFPWT